MLGFEVVLAPHEIGILLGFGGPRGFLGDRLTRFTVARVVS